MRETPFKRKCLSDCSLGELWSSSFLIANKSSVRHYPQLPWGFALGHVCSSSEHLSLHASVPSSLNVFKRSRCDREDKQEDGHWKAGWDPLQPPAAKTHPSIVRINVWSLQRSPALQSQYLSSTQGTKHDTKVNTEMSNCSARAKLLQNGDFGDFFFFCLGWFCVLVGDFLWGGCWLVCLFILIVKRRNNLSCWGLVASVWITGPGGLHGADVCKSFYRNAVCLSVNAVLATL